MNKTEKLLQKLSPKQRSLVLRAILRLQTGDRQGLDIKPLKGHKALFRMRVGNCRVIFTESQDVFKLVEIVKRDDQTYRDF
jgi:mRNA-degrading endonuclease RelE of RelBE toxin-antitoxin system